MSQNSPPSKFSKLVEVLMSHLKVLEWLQDENRGSGAGLRMCGMAVRYILLYQHLLAAKYLMITAVKKGIGIE